MSWLSRIFNYVPVSEQGGIELLLTPAAAWEVEYDRKKVDIQAFFRSLTLLVPAGSVLYLEGGAVTQDVRAYLLSRQAAKTVKVAFHTTWPRREFFHVDITQENLEGLAELGGHHAEIEIASHVSVYKDNDVLLEWHDAWGENFQVSKKISEKNLIKFCAVFGVLHKEYK